VQFRDTGNIGYTIENGAIQRHWQHWVHNREWCNSETLATLGTHEEDNIRKHNTAQKSKYDMINNHYSI
jgi:hypothetical protein